jgi:hypothetical protein
MRGAKQRFKAERKNISLHSTHGLNDLRLILWELRGKIAKTKDLCGHFSVFPGRTSAIHVTRRFNASSAGKIPRGLDVR